MKINIIANDKQGEPDRVVNVSLRVDSDGDLVLTVDESEVTLVFAESEEVNDNVHSGLQVAFGDRRCV